METKTNGKKLCNVETKVLMDTRNENLPEAMDTTNVEHQVMYKPTKEMDTLVDDLAQAKAKTVSNTLSDGKEEALAKYFAHTLAEEEGKTVGQAVSEVQAKVLMHQLPFILPESKAKTLGDTLSDMEAKALVETLLNPSIRNSGQ